MDDDQGSDGWSQASDGQWYPPEQDPRRPAPPPPPSPPDRAERIAAGRKKARRRGCFTVVLGGLALVAVIAAIAAIAGGGDDDDGSEEPTVDPAAVGTAAGAAQPDPTGAGAAGVAGAADEVDDVGPCTLVDSDTITLDVTNNSSDQSNYLIDVNFLDAAGQRVSDETFFLNHLRSGERALQQHRGVQRRGRGHLRDRRSGPLVGAVRR